jgi:N-methylhydantoinase B
MSTSSSVPQEPLPVPISAKRDIDPITFSVILNRFNTIAREMTLTLEYSAWTTILALARDFSCAIYDSQARQVCMLDALPVHTNSLHVVLKEIARVFEGEVYEGDVIVCNDPYSGNTHVADLVTACPVFYKGKHLFWSVTKGHQLDCGAFLPTSVAAAAKDVWQEGLAIPPIKFYEKGQPRQDVIRLYLANVRWKELLYGDLMAQLGSIWTGQKRMMELVDEYGVEELERYIEEIFAYADLRTAEDIRRMPSGTYVGETWIDTDGQGHADSYIRASVTIADDTVHVDFSGSDPQVPGSTNASYGVMQAAAGIPLLCCIDPTIPHNEGCLRHITATAPKGSICNAEYPASTAPATIVPGDPMQDAVWKALAQAIPERVAAGYGRFHCIPALSGTDRREETQRDWGAMFFNGGSGGGASAVADGWPLIMTTAGMGGLKILSLELSELLFPVTVESMEIEPDSMGHGKQIGGAGVRIALRPIGSPMENYLFGDGATNPPHGVLGGTSGIGGGNYKENDSTGKRTYCSTKGHLTIHEDEVWVGISSGGGGYGDPLERDPHLVQAGVRDEMIGLEAAREIYGVVLDPRSLALDLRATHRLRQEIAGERGDLELVTPNVPSASRWLQDHMREGDEFLLDPQ